MSEIELPVAGTAIDPDLDRLLVGRSFPYFMTKHWLVPDKRRDRAKPYTNFKTDGAFEFLQPLLYAWQHCPADLVADKSRQGGISTIAAGRAGWMGITEEDREGEIMGRNEDSSINLKNKVEYALKKMELNSPHLFVQGKFPKVQTQRVYFPETNTNLSIKPHTADAARGDSTDMFMLDEWAFHEWARENWAAVAPTTDWGGQFFGISTPKYGTLYSEIVEDATRIASGEPMPPKPRGWHPDSQKPLEQHIAEWALWLDWFCRRIGWDWQKQRSIFPVKDIPWPVGENGFMLMRIHWSYNMLRRREWVDRIWRKLKRDRMLFMQEYELDASQAQLLVFDNDNSRAIYMPPDVAKEKKILLGIEAVRWGEDYVLAVDVSEGLEHGDRSIIKLMHMDTGLVLQTWELPLDIEGLAAMMNQIYRKSKFIGANVTVAPDATGTHGGSLIATIRYLYPDMLSDFYSMEDPVSSMGSKQSYVNKGKSTGAHSTHLGFVADRKTKPQAIQELNRAINNRLICETDAETITELCQYEHKGNRKTGAPDGPYFDDRVSCLAIAHWVRRHRALLEVQTDLTPAFGLQSSILIPDRHLVTPSRNLAGAFAGFGQDFGGW